MLLLLLSTLLGVGRIPQPIDVFAADFALSIVITNQGHPSPSSKHEPTTLYISRADLSFSFFSSYVVGFVVTQAPLYQFFPEGLFL